MSFGLNTKLDHPALKQKFVNYKYLYKKQTKKNKNKQKQKQTNESLLIWKVPLKTLLEIKLDNPSPQKNR